MDTKDDENVYQQNVELGCTVCGIPARSLTSKGEQHVKRNNMTSVFTRWGHHDCGPNARRIYEGIVVGSLYYHSGGGANSICMTTSGASPPSGYSLGNENG